jgi:methionine synthase II (cobalamin-independent)
MAIVAQEAAGLEPLTDGRLAGIGTRSLEAWQLAAALTTHAVKQSLPGPYSLAFRRSPGASAARRAKEALHLVDELRGEVIALAEAGCPFVEIEEAEAHRIGTDAAERSAYRDAHLALTDGVEGTHLSLAIVGGNADVAGIETILAPAYSSLAVDLIAGSDNWRLVAQAPATVGIVAGAMSARPDGDEGPEVILFAARYAASTQARGSDRIGLAISPGLENLPWDVALRKLNAIGRAARIAALPPGDELAEALDPRALDIRSAALGRREPRPERRR